MHKTILNNKNIKKSNLFFLKLTFLKIYYKIKSMNEQIKKTIDDLVYFINKNKDILTDNKQLLELLQEAKEIYYNKTFNISVVGSLKAGKSTILNSILDCNLLKTGAGTVTDSLISVENSYTKKAVIYFKQKADIINILNAELNIIGYKKEIKEITPEIITNIKQYIESLKQNKSEKYYNNSFIIKYIQSIILSYENFHYLGETIIFENEDFYNYKNWVGDETKTVYIEKIKLYYPFNDNYNKVVFSDTPGSDSIFIRHSQELSNFLKHSDIILYIISSRYGLREADYKLINKIMTLNPDNRIKFIINIYIDDFNNINEINASVEKIKKNLQDFINNIEVYPYSALYINDKNSKNKQEYETDRAKMWEKKRDIIIYIQNNYNNLISEIKNIAGEGLNQISDTIIINKINIVKKHINWIYDFVENFKHLILNDITVEKKHFKSIKLKLHTLKTSLKGTERELIDKYFEVINNIMDWSGEISEKANEKLKNYYIDKEKYYKELKSIGDINTIYNIIKKNIYNEFNIIMEDIFNTKVYSEIKKMKIELDSFFNNKLNNINDEINAIFTSVLKDINKESFNSNSKLNIFETDTNTLNKCEIEMPVLKTDYLSNKESNFNSSFYLKYSLNFSYLNIKKLYGKILKKKPINIDYILAKKIVDDIETTTKNELLQETKFQFTNFKENIKHQYIKKIINYYTNELTSNLNEKEDFLFNKILNIFNLDKEIIEKTDFDNTQIKMVLK